MVGNALKMDKKQSLCALFRLGWSDRAINRETGIHRETIRLYRIKFETVPEVPADSQPFGAGKIAGSTDTPFQTVPKVPTDPTAKNPPLPRTNSPYVEPHRAYIRDALATGLDAQRVYQDLVEEHDFKGSYDCIKRYARKLRTHQPRWFERLPTSPGREAQVDFGTAPCLVLKDGKYRHPYFFKMTLSHSRHAYEELVWRQDAETWIKCHMNAFRSFNGVPQTVKLDNLKAGVIKPDLYDPSLNTVYAAFAEHTGFVPLPCQPYQPNQKGRVEHDVGYTKSNGLANKRFESLDDWNIALRSWNKRWASTRIHGTTRVQVKKMFDETERMALQPLPEKEFQFFKSEIRKVDVQGCIAVNRNFYSVPYTYIRKEVLVHINADRIRVLDLKTHKLLISHKVLDGVGKVTFREECKPPYANKPKEYQEIHYCRKARAIGSSCEKLVSHILVSDEYKGILRVRGILKLADTISSRIVEAACADALKLNQTRYSNIKALCAAIASYQPKEEEVKLTQSHECIRNIDEYQNHFNEKVEQA